MASAKSCIEEKMCIDEKLPVTVKDSCSKFTKQVQRAQWLRAAILGANDGLLSTSSLMLGVGATKDDRSSMILSGLAGALAGACSMAVGEFVSVSTQRDIEKTIITMCKSKFEHDNDKNNTNFIVNPIINFEDAPPKMGKIAAFVSSEPKPILLASPRKPPITLVVQRENDIEETMANPYKAAIASSLAFLCGSLVPLGSVAFVPNNIIRIVVLVIATSLALAFFGGFGAYLGGSMIRASMIRVVMGGWISMVITYSLLKPFDKVYKD